MNFLLRTLSLSYVRRHLMKTLLTLLGVVVGVATFSAIRSAQGTLVKGIRSTVDRVAGKAHLQITTTGGVPEEVQEKIRTFRASGQYRRSSNRSWCQSGGNWGA